MAELTNILQWVDKKGWCSVSVNDPEIQAIPERDTINAKSHCFMCEFCGSYVTLTRDGKKVRHFRHSRGDQEKVCIQRSQTVKEYCNNNFYSIPIKIVVTSNDFYFKVGLYFKYGLDFFSNIKKVIVKSSTSQFEYLNERMCVDGVSYLSVGNSIEESYILEYEFEKDLRISTDVIDIFLPKQVSAITQKATIFDANSGKIIPYGGDVLIKKEYYLLIDQQIFASDTPFNSLSDVFSLKLTRDKWFLYYFKATEFTSKVAEFFNDYNYRLAETPIKIQTLWPLFIENSYSIKYNSEYFWLHTCGSPRFLDVFPLNKSKKLLYGDIKPLHKINSLNRQQVVSVGRAFRGTRAPLYFSFYFKEKLNFVEDKPKVQITDIKGNNIDEREYSNLPLKKTLVFNSHMDSLIVIKNNNITIKKILLKANQNFEYKQLSMNISIFVYVGCDCVWETNFIQKYSKDLKIDEDVLLNILKHTNSSYISISHSFANIVLKFEKYPKIKQWLYNCIRQGKIKKSAFYYLSSLYKQQFD